MGLMMLAAGIGSQIELACSGRQASDAMAAPAAQPIQVRRASTVTPPR